MDESVWLRETLRADFASSTSRFRSQGGSMAASTGTGSVLVCALDDIEWQRIGKHRGPGLKMKSLAFRDDGRGNNLWLSLSEMEDGWPSPPPMHTFSQST